MDTIETSKPQTEADDLVAYLRDTARLDADTPTALYQRLEDALRGAIRDRVLPPGGVIPGERELAQRLSISRVTIRKAIRALVDDRLLVQRQGARTAVAERVEKPVSVLTSFSQDMLARGLAPGTVWLAKDMGVALPAEAMELGLSPGTEVCRLRRLRTADGQPMALELSIVPAAYLPSPDLVETSLYTVLEERGHSPSRALQRMRSSIVGGNEAKLLGVPPGAPILEIERRVFLEGGQTVEYCRSLYRGDTYDFLVELHR
ncbi:GntR family transcriptional regulator [Kaistia dalseonensis]|uniref:GntR family transcriptional regulator n=1 Tax=Kaistia dalseonensis TaxID=410840 RepID=A0ABU0H782_9HYPH|nr:GntR family transcriptional regulator [Kaistia dalseonensis]MCX5494788.1 GntR family transcriptional regulator [Kaistia dalseonensis]MDQ0437369.1 GntR family transcriptional regulator [Kaistia dalseonensis]